MKATFEDDIFFKPQVNLGFFALAYLSSYSLDF
jgi:hypothetical protein